MRWVLYLVVIVLIACQPERPTNPTPAPATLQALGCAAIRQIQPDVTCLNIPADTMTALLLQTDQQMTLRAENLNITFDATIYLSHTDDNLILALLEGTGAIGAGGETRVVVAGTQASVPIEVDPLRSTGPPSPPGPYPVNQLRELPLNGLPRAVQLVAPLAIDTPQPTPAPDCTTPPEWTALYTIQRGDTLTLIANQYGVTTTELAQGNCITNPNRISPGDVLYVPAETVTVPITASGVFYADQTSLPDGDCAVLSWNAESEQINAEVRLVMLGSEAIARSGSRQVCPPSTTTYTLLVLLESGEQREYPLTITVD